MVRVPEPKQKLKEILKRTVIQNPIATADWKVVHRREYPLGQQLDGSSLVGQAGRMSRTFSKVKLKALGREDTQAKVAVDPQA